MRAGPRPDAPLVRAIGVRRLTASIVNVTVGAGIFVLPATAAAGLGSAAPFAYLVCAAAMALIVACFAAAGSRVSLTGGLYAYAEVAFGPFIGFLTGVLYWLSCIFGAASVASALVASIAVFWPAADQGILRPTILLIGLGSIAAVNVRGVAPGTRLIEAVTVAKLAPLLVLVAAGLWIAPVDPRGWLPVPEAAAVGQTALVLIFAFVGIEVALVPGGEIRDPPRTVPRAVFAALAITTALYLSLQAVVQEVLGSAIGDFASAPLGEAAARILGPTGRTVVMAGMAVSMFGYLSGDMLGTPRVLYAFGRDRILPARLADVHPRFRTPWLAIIVHAAVVWPLAATGTFVRLAVFSTVATLAMYLICVAAAYQLQRRDVRSDGPPFVLPGGGAIAAGAAALIVWLLSQATPLEFIVTAAVLAAASVLYRIRYN